MSTFAAPVSVPHSPRFRPLWRARPSLIGLFCLVLCQALEAAADNPRCLAIVGTNDVHGAIEAHEVCSQDRSACVRAGGIRAFSGYVRALRETFGERLMLLDAGDIFWGTLASNMAQGEPIVAAYNAMGYTAATLGNHEFDFGAAPESPHDRTSAIRKRMREADFPFVVSNMDSAATGERAAWDNLFGSILRDVGGIRVGIIGAATPTTPQTTRPANVATLRFRPPLQAVVLEARALRRRGAELIVLLAHMGGQCQSLNDPSDLSSCNVGAEQAELFHLLRDLPPKTVDVAVGGHTHQVIAHWAYGAAVIESGARSEKFGYIEACINPDDAGGLLDAKTVIHAPVDICETTWADGTCRPRQKPTATFPAHFLGRPVTPSTEVVALTEPFLERVRSVSRMPTGILLPRALSARELSSLVAEAMRRSQAADFGLQNRGGVRSGLKKGPVTFGQIYEAVPFDNDVAVATMHAPSLQQFLWRLLRHNVGPEGHTLVGLRLEGPNPEHFVTDKGRPLLSEAVYTLATTDFMLQGGDGAPRPESNPKLTELSMREALVQLLLQLYPAEALQKEDTP